MSVCWGGEGGLDYLAGEGYGMRGLEVKAPGKVGENRWGDVGPGVGGVGVPVEGDG